MIHTLLIEAYTLPVIVPVEVTILRGARRLRFSSSLRRRYNDFSPKIWHLLTKLGYKKYLQRIYVTIEHDGSLLSPYYQFPLLLGILEALELIPEQNNLVTLGKIDVYNKVHAPFTINDLPNTGGFAAYLPHKLPFQQEVNNLLTNSPTAQSRSTNPFSIRLLSTIIPQGIFTNDGLDITRTQLSCLKKIPTELIPYIPFAAFTTKTTISSQRSAIIEELFCNCTDTITTISNKKETAITAVSSFLKQFVKT
jgi:hypothetical protein